MGEASVSLPVSAVAGTYQLRAAYGGDADRAPSSVSTLFTVNRANTSLALAVAPSRLGEPTGITARLTTAGGATLDQRTVFFTVVDGSTTMVRSAITNLKGVARIDLPPGGPYTVSARFLGPNSADRTYSPASAGPVMVDTVVYLSSSKDGEVGGVSYNEEDIIAFNTATGQWSLVFDGSDVGLDKTPVDGFELITGPSGIEAINMSFGKKVTLAGIGQAEDTDVVTLRAHQPGSEHRRQLHRRSRRRFHRGVHQGLRGHRRHHPLRLEPDPVHGRQGRGARDRRGTARRRR